MAKSSWKKGTPLDDALQAQLKQLIREHGEKRVAEMLNVSQTAVMRGAAGCGLRQGTMLMLQSRLSAVKQAAQAA